MSDILTIKQRLDELVLHYGTQKALGDKLGVSQAAVAMYYKRNSYPVDLFLNKLTDISTEWLRFGSGRMLVNEQEQDEDMALEILHLSYDDLEAFRKWKSSHTDNKGTRTYEQTELQCYQLSDGEAVDRALLNMLLAEKSVLEQKIATLEHRNLELEKLNARLEERFAGATAWYYSAISQHPDLKK